MKLKHSAQELESWYSGDNLLFNETPKSNPNPLTDLIHCQVGGKLRCIGSPQHLKTRFGNHLELEVIHVSYLFCI